MNNKNPPYLSLDEELLLIQKAKEGDEKSKIILYEKYKKLIFKIAKQYQYFDLELNELISEGIIGFFYSIVKFDINKNVRLDTYSTWWIREKICKALKKQGNLFKLSTHKFKEINKVNKLKKQLTQNDYLNKKDLIKTISEKLNLTEKEVEEDLMLLNNVTSLNTSINDTQNNGELHEIIGKDDESFNEVISKIDKSILKEKVQLLINELIGLEKKVIEQYYLKSKKLRQIAEENKIPYEQVRALKNNGLRHLTQIATRDELYKYL